MAHRKRHVPFTYSLYTGRFNCLEIDEALYKLKLKRLPKPDSNYQMVYIADEWNSFVLRKFYIIAIFYSKPANIIVIHSMCPVTATHIYLEESPADGGCDVGRDGGRDVGISDKLVYLVKIMDYLPQNNIIAIKIGDIVKFAVYPGIFTYSNHYKFVFELGGDVINMYVVKNGENFVLSTLKDINADIILHDRVDDVATFVASIEDHIIEPPCVIRCKVLSDNMDEVSKKVYSRDGKCFIWGLFCGKLMFTGVTVESIKQATRTKPATRGGILEND